MGPIEHCVVELRRGRTTSEALVEQCLAAIDAPDGEGSRAFLKIYRNEALALARAADRARLSGDKIPMFAGVPISVKDIFDVEGEVTTAGSRVLADTPPAVAHAPVIARLRAAGFILIGRTNMTEFAYSGVGLNPHFGTPRNPYDRGSARIPGGSSSGAAISVSDSMAAGAIGTDTGGSCRIPAALVGLVGFKPTARRVPLAGIVPLSPSLDSIGPIAQTVTSCALLDAVLSGRTNRILDTIDAPPRIRPGDTRTSTDIRLAIPLSPLLDGMDQYVSRSFDRALSKIGASGADISDVPVFEFTEISQINADGGFAAAESWAWHRALLEEKEARYDPRVASRIRQGSTQSATDYNDLIAARRVVQHSVDQTIARIDAFIMPTVQSIAPQISALDDDEDYYEINRMMLRNPSVVNFLDLCAITIPCHRSGEAPVGLTLIGPRNGDRRLFELSLKLEEILSNR